MELDIEKRIAKDFGAKASDAIGMLNEFNRENAVEVRILRSIIRLSSGDLLRLKNEISNAATDWRDVVDSAEAYPFELKKPFEVND